MGAQNKRVARALARRTTRDGSVHGARGRQGRDALARGVHTPGTTHDTRRALGKYVALVKYDGL